MSQSSNVPNTVWVPTADEQVEVLVYRSTRQPYIDPGTRSEWRRPRQVSSAPRVANTDGISENTASLNVQGSSLSPRGEPSSATHYTAEGSNAHISPKATQAVLSREEIVTERLVPPVESVAGPSNPLHKEFKRRSEPRKFFKAGKVFITPFTEPLGQLNKTTVGTEATFTDQYGGRHFCKVRRFIVISEKADSCTALPILTYSGRGCGKRSVVKSDHGIAYTGKSPPLPTDAEQPSNEDEFPMRSFPVRIDVDNRGEKLDQMSRICYSKPHTIDHRVEVKPFGMVNKDSWYPLMRQFDEVWLRSLGGSRGRYPPGGDSSSQRGSSRGQHILQTAIGERSQRPAAPEPTREAQLTSRRGSQNQAPPLQLTAAAINCAAVAALCRSGTVNEQQAAGIVRSHISAAMAEANRPLSIPESFEVAIRAIASRGGGNERARETLGAMLRQ